MMRSGISKGASWGLGGRVGDDGGVPLVSVAPIWDDVLVDAEPLMLAPRLDMNGGVPGVSRWKRAGLGPE